MILLSIAYVCPVLALPTSLGLLEVQTIGVPTNGTNPSVDGPFVLMGILGSCARANNDAHMGCTPSSVKPFYDLSVIPKDESQWLFLAPIFIPTLIAICLAFSGVFFLVFIVMAWRRRDKSATNPLVSARPQADVFDSPRTEKYAVILGTVGFVFGLLAFGIVRIWFGKNAYDFNLGVEIADDPGPVLQASVANGFRLVWVGYAFHAGPLLFYFMKFHFVGAPRTGSAAGAAGAGMVQQNFGAPPQQFGDPYAGQQPPPGF